LASERFYSIYFANNNVGWAVGEDGVIIKSIDGGVNWTNQSSGATNRLRSVFFTNENVGYAVGDSRILKTTNGGNEWVSHSVGHALYSVYFSDANTGYAVGGNTGTGIIVKTTNAGQDWTEQFSGVSKKLNSVCFHNNDIGWIVGFSGTILKTLNGGQNWFQQASPINSELNSIQVTNELNAKNCSKQWSYY